MFAHIERRFQPNYHFRSLDEYHVDNTRHVYHIHLGSSRMLVKMTVSRTLSAHHQCHHAPSGTATKTEKAM